MASEVPQLFAGLKFWISRNVPQRQYIIAQAREHGADIVLLEAQADHMLADPLRKPPPPGAISFDFIQSSIRNGCLQDPTAHRISVPSRAERPVGSVTVASRGGRTKFTEEEDQFLYDFVTPFRNLGGKWKGNEIYKQLERLRPEHTFQSWRDRYIKHVSLQKRSVTAHLSVDPELLHDDPDAIRSPKRRRVDQSPNRGTENTNVPDQIAARSHQPIAVEDLLQTFYNKTRSKHNFSYNDFKSMYDAVPDILKCTDESSRKGFTDVAKDKGHTVEAWQSLYEDIILPEFRRHNDLQDDVKFKDYLEALIVTKLGNDRGKPLARNDVQQTDVSATGDQSIQPQEPISPSTLRTDVRANQGRKRAGHSQSQSQSQSTATSSGTQLSQPLQQVEQTVDSGTGPEGFDSLKRNEGLLPSTTLPIAFGSSSARSHDIPESGQRPPRNFAPTPPSPPRGGKDAGPTTQLRPATASRSPTKGGNQSKGVQLLSDNDVIVDSITTNPHVDAGSDHAFSDTGSEYHPFDTAPERSQFWSDTPIVEQSPSKSSVSRNDGTDEKEDDGVEEDEFETAPHERDRTIAARLDTQVLFQQTLTDHVDNEFGFDLPDPAGGWAELGVDEDEVEATVLTEMQNLQGEKVLETTERSDADADVTPHSLRHLSEDKREDSAQALPDRHAALTVSSGRTEEESEMTEEEEQDDEEEAAAETVNSMRLPQIKAKHHRSSSYSSGVTDSEGGADSAALSSESVTPTFDDILSSARRRNRHLSAAVIQRLTTTAVQACTLDLRLAKSVVGQMIESLQEQPQFRSNRGWVLDKMSEDEAKVLIPENVRGCWTREDDQSLLSGTRWSGRGGGRSDGAEGIQRVEKKHGVAETAERVSLLAVKYRARTGFK